MKLLKTCIRYLKETDILTFQRHLSNLWLAIITTLIYFFDAVLEFLFMGHVHNLRAYFINGISKVLMTQRQNDIVWLHAAVCILSCPLSYGSTPDDYVHGDHAFFMDSLHGLNSIREAYPGLFDPRSSDLDRLTALVELMGGVKPIHHNRKLMAVVTHNDDFHEQLLMEFRVNLRNIKHAE